MRRLTLPVLVSLLTAPSLAAQQRPTCAPDNAGLTLPSGFCALIVADSLGRARHLVVAPNGDVLVATSPSRGGGSSGGVVVLRDTNGDGRADIVGRFAEGTGNGIRLHGLFLYYATNDAVMRFPWRVGELRPTGPVDTIVRGLPANRSHTAKSIAFGPDGALYVDIGSPTNACQTQDRRPGVRGEDPCPALETRAGVWRFDANKSGQTQADGTRFATGLRNVVALAVRPQDGHLYGVQHGRDQLANNWPALFTDEQSAELPAEEFVRMEQGDDFGWPYCFYDWQQQKKVLGPEYGGDGKTVGRCASKKLPLIGFPGHWAPNGLLFYAGEQFPASYKGGAFIAFHGSWNRAPLPQQGFKVVFVPFQGDNPASNWTTFADGFGGLNQASGQAAHRPVGLAQGPDGSLYVTDDTGGRVYRILYRGSG